MRCKTKTIAVLLSGLILLSSDMLAVTPGQLYRTPLPVSVDTFYRTELYFGRSIPGGAMVSDAEWERFLADVVTPKFPDGFTIVKATGQYRERNGNIDKEPSEILLFFYPARTRIASRRKIEDIRRAYKKQFRQESVLRLEFRSRLNVSF